MDRDSGEKADLKKDLKATRQKIAALESETHDVLLDLGRHLVNLGIDGGYAEIGDLIRKATNLWGTVLDTEEEIAYTRRLEEDYRTFKMNFADTKREVKKLSARTERQIGRLGEQASSHYHDRASSHEYRSSFEEVIKEDEDVLLRKPEEEAENDVGRTGLVKRLNSLRKLLDLKGKDRRSTGGKANPFVSLGWRLLKADFDRHTDGKLAGFFETVRKNLMNLLELERHLRHQKEGLAAFDREMKKEWGYIDPHAMANDLDNQRAEMQDALDSLHLRIGDIFNEHRLHNYVDDSFVRACRQRIKRFHVRINELKFRQKDLLLALKNEKSLDKRSDKRPDKRPVSREQSKNQE